jgi:hypothetical protein
MVTTKEHNVSDEKVKGFLEELETFKERIVEIYAELGLGKDEVLRAHAGIDTAVATVASHGPHEGADLNDDLAETPEDHPAALGQEPTPIAFDEPAADPEVPAQNPARRTGSADTPEPALAAGDPVRSKDEFETQQVPTESGSESVQPDVKPV